MELRIKRLDPELPEPIYAKSGDAGFDLRATKNFTIYPGETVKIGTGIAVEIPEGYNGEVRPRSGMAGNWMLAPINSPGTIDSGYRGEIIVPLHNYAPTVRVDWWDEDYVTRPNIGATRYVKRGDRIAQLVITPCVQAEFVEVSELSETERGGGGFGSSGVK